MGDVASIDGMRVAIIGAGPSGAAFASALLASARALGRHLEVTLYGGPSRRGLAPPAIVEAESRCRLASLGAALPVQPDDLEIQGVLVHAAGQSAILEPPASGLRIIDGPGERAGSRFVRRLLSSAAGLRGAKIRPWQVDAVEVSGNRAVVRAQGYSESYDLAAGAFGPSSELMGHWLSGRFKPPRRTPGAHARLAWKGEDALLRIFLCPSPEIDVLIFVPSRPAAYAFASGPAASEQTLARALMGLARDRALPSGLSLIEAEPYAVVAGASQTLARGCQATLGAAVCGGPLEIGLLGALVSAARAANAVLEVGVSRALERRLLGGQADLFAHVRRQVRIVRWARRAGPRGPRALSRLALRSRFSQSEGFGLFGLTFLDSRAALSTMRMQAIARSLSDLVAPIFPPEPEPAPSNALVYVVDDDDDARAALVDLLRARGADARALDEFPLLESAARERPAAVLLDVVLRWVDGLSLCRALRAHPSTARARLIAMSSLGRAIDREAARAAGADGFLAKPINLAELEQHLAGVLPSAAGAARSPMPRAAKGL
jgi:CheY-like chemotaxis protein